MFSQSPLFLQSESIACYFSTPHEFATHFLLELILKNKKKCYLPAVQEQILLFFPYETNTPLIANQFGILEPAIKTQNKSPEALDVVLLPLLAFDKTGNRLGSGCGFYDKTFIFKQARKMQKPFFIGVAYDAQKIDIVPHDAYDIPLDAVLTESSITFF